MSTAREHAVMASELLDSEWKVATRIEELDDDQRLQLIVTGGVKRLNRDRQWTVDLAAAHALTSLALSFSEHETEVAR